MNSTGDLDRCFSFINSQLKPSAVVGGFGHTGPKYRAVTISRQAGSGAHALAELLAAELSAHEPHGSTGWTFFDRNLVEHVLADHHMPARLARFMPEDRVSDISDVMDELFGLHPPSWLLVRQTSETILRLARLGKVILIGRGANLITRRLPYVFHVRLVGSLEKRVERLQKSEQLRRQAAIRFAQREDLARQRYLKQFFGKEIDDPLLYHLVINTDLISIQDAARMVLPELSAGLLAKAAA